MLVVSLSPCMDKTAELHHFEMDSANRVKILRRDVGGKGVNVAVMLRHLKEEVRLIGVDFPESGNPVKKVMSEENIPCCLSPVPGLLRTNLKIHDLSKDCTIEINEESAAIPASVFESLKKNILSQAQKGEWVILTGSLPPPIPCTFVKDICRQLKEQGCLTAVDADGAVLREALLACPDFLKPNDQEFSRLTGKIYADEQEKIQACRQLMTDYHLPCVCLSCGKKGAYLFTEKEIFFASALSVPVKSVHGAGDAALSGILSAFRQGKSGKEALQWGIASSNATVQKEGTKMGDYDEFLRLLPLADCHLI